MVMCPNCYAMNTQEQKPRRIFSFDELVDGFTLRFDCLECGYTFSKEFIVSYKIE